IRDGHVTGVQTCALPIWLRVAANLALPGISPRPDSNAYDVRVRVKDWPKFPSTFLEYIEVFHTSSDVMVSGQPNLRVGLVPGGEIGRASCRKGVGVGGWR